MRNVFNRFEIGLSQSLLVCSLTLFGGVAGSGQAHAANGLSAPVSAAALKACTPPDSVMDPEAYRGLSPAQIAYLRSLENKDRHECARLITAAQQAVNAAAEQSTQEAKSGTKPKPSPRPTPTPQPEDPGGRVIIIGGIVVNTQCYTNYGKCLADSVANAAQARADCWYLMFDKNKFDACVKQLHVITFDYCTSELRKCTGLPFPRIPFPSSWKANADAPDALHSSPLHGCDSPSLNIDPAAYRGLDQAQRKYLLSLEQKTRKECRQQITALMRPTAKASPGTKRGLHPQSTQSFAKPKPVPAPSGTPPTTYGGEDCMQRHYFCMLSAGVNQLQAYTTCAYLLVDPDKRKFHACVKENIKITAQSCNKERTMCEGGVAY